MIYLSNNHPIAKRIIRIVHGERGSYAEFEKEDMLFKNLIIPIRQKWRLRKEWKDKVFYIEWRTKQGNIKVYQQLKTVDYADYKIGMFYISEESIKIRNN